MKILNIILFSIFFTNTISAEVIGNTIDLNKSLVIRQSHLAQQIIYSRKINVHERGTLIVHANADIYSEACIAKLPLYKNFYCGKSSFGQDQGKARSITNGKFYLIVTYQGPSSKSKRYIHRDFGFSGSQPGKPVENIKFTQVIPVDNYLVLPNVFPGDVTIQLAFQHFKNTAHVPYYRASLKNVTHSFYKH